MSISVRSVSTLQEAAQAISAGGTARYMGGGTLVMRAVNEGDQSFDTIVLTEDPALTQVSPAGDRIAIGAGVTMAGILASRELDFLHPAARAVGGPAVRSMATVGGNLFAAHPYGDLATALLVLDGKVSLAGGGGRQEMQLSDLLASRGSAPHPLVSSVSILRPRAGEFRFRKVSRVRPKGVAVMTIAACVPVSAAGKISGVRIAFGAMGPAPFRVSAVEQALEGASLDEAGIARALEATTAGVDPPEDAIVLAWYRKEVARVHLKRVLLQR